MPAECERCGRPAPAAGSQDHVTWQARVRKDGSVAVICPECLAKVDAAAIDEGRMWSELEQLPPEDLGARRTAPRAGSIQAMSAKDTPAAARAGDWLEARGIHGEPARRGQIVEILGEPGHEHYKVRWDEQHESIVYPADGVHIVRKRHR